MLTAATRSTCKSCTARSDDFLLGGGFVAVRVDRADPAPPVVALLRMGWCQAAQLVVAVLSALQDRAHVVVVALERGRADLAYVADAACAT